jgi:hypothetical protein
LVSSTKIPSWRRRLAEIIAEMEMVGEQVAELLAQQADSHLDTRTSN